MSESEVYIPPEAESFRQEHSTEKEVNLGESVMPFENFDNKYKIEKSKMGGEEASISSEEFQTEGIGNWRVSASYLSPEHKFSGLGLDDEKHKVLLALPDNEQTILPSQLQDFIEKTETRLLDISISVGEPDLYSRGPSTDFRISLPSGKELTTSFDAGVSKNYQEPNGETYQAILVPAVANLIEKIEVTPERVS